MCVLSEFQFNQNTSAVEYNFHKRSCGSPLCAAAKKVYFERDWPILYRSSLTVVCSSPSKMTKYLWVTKTVYFEELFKTTLKGTLYWLSFLNTIQCPQTFSIAHCSRCWQFFSN